MNSMNQDEIRLKIPKLLLEEFQKNPRVIVKIHPTGLLPIDIAILKKADAIEKMLNDPDFRENFDLVAIPKKNISF